MLSFGSHPRLFTIFYDLVTKRDLTKISYRNICIEVVDSCYLIPRVFLLSIPAPVEWDHFVTADGCFAHRADLSAGPRLEPLMQTWPAA